MNFFDNNLVMGSLMSENQIIKETPVIGINIYKDRPEVFSLKNKIEKIIASMPIVVKIEFNIRFLLPLFSFISKYANIEPASSSHPLVGSK